MKLFVLRLLLVLATAPSLAAQQSGIDQDLELVTFPDGEHAVRWQGKPGRTYFLQISTTNDPLARWTWSPYIDFGSGAEISHEVGGTAARCFFRLHYTDQVPPQGVALEDWDIDGDGLGNLEEITHYGTPPIRSSPTPTETGQTTIGRSVTITTRTIRSTTRLPAVTPTWTG